jgi:hypothetical protein
MAPNQDSFLNAYVDLDLIQHKTLSNLYSARPAIHSWRHMQKEIFSLTTELNRWALQALPHSLSAASIAEPSLGREQSVLHFYYLSVKICITRPCLCRSDLRSKGQNEKSAEFNWKTAEACVQAAMDLALLLPEPLNSRWIYEKGPWWSSVHISKSQFCTKKGRLTFVVMQAITVLLLELAQGTIHWPTDPSNIATCVEKLTRWLKAMSSNDVVSERAYNIVCKMLSKHKQSREDVATGQLATEMEQPYNEPAAASYMASQANSGNFDLNSQARPLNKPPADFLFGQTQLPLFFGDHFMTKFDQGTDYYGLDGYTQHGQQAPQ